MKYISADDSISRGRFTVTREQAEHNPKLRRFRVVATNPDLNILVSEDDLEDLADLFGLASFNYELCDRIDGGDREEAFV